MANGSSAQALLHIDWILVVSAAWLLVGAAGVAALRRLAFVARVLFPLGGALGLVLFGLAVSALGDTPEVAVLPIGLPSLPFHLRLDSLAAYFLMVIGAASAGISVFAAGYFRKGEGTPPGLLCMEYHVFLASMVGVVLADDAYAFMVMWETMALSSFFLVTANHRIPEVRSAGYLYITMAHIGAIAILLCFGVLQANTGDYTFDNMRAQRLEPFWASVGFLLAVLGFGAKAGVLPLHVWLPEAHPAAPSPVSALMSGVMLKTAIYGMLRTTFDLIGTPTWWWGLIPLGLGLFTALYGVIFAATQSDMKRLLAYSSIENIGILFTGIGLAIVFHGVGMDAMAALALIAVLYHAINHAFMKSLLFLSTGAVLHATGERNLGHLGGLIHRMPWVAWLTLVGVLAIAGLPPLNGFVSEWLLLQAFLLAHEVPKPFVNMLLPLGAALLVLSAALAGYVMVKFYGIVFLGQPREAALHDAHDASVLERVGLVWLAAGCVLLGLLPAQIVPMLAGVVADLGINASAAVTSAQSWWMLAPLPARSISYAPLVFTLAVVSAVLVTVLVGRLVYRRRTRRADPWDCGYERINPRMQDTAEGFGQPIRHLFQPFFAMDRELPSPFDRAPRYRVVVFDRLWRLLYLPIERIVQRAANAVSVLQQGRISAYLLYSFVTLIVLLASVL